MFSDSELICIKDAVEYYRKRCKSYRGPYEYEQKSINEMDNIISICERKLKESDDLLRCFESLKFRE